MRPIIVNLELRDAKRVGKSTVRWQWQLEFHNMFDNMYGIVALADEK